MSDRIVADCAVMAALLLPDEHSAVADGLQAHFVRGGTVVVPALCWYEMANVLVVAERRRRLASRDAGRVVELLSRLHIETDEDTGPGLLRRVRNIAQEERLSAYDAAYVELAERTSLPLLSIDDAVIRAALARGIPLASPEVRPGDR